MEEVVKDALEDCRPVQVSLPRHQNLTLVCVAGDDSGRDELATTGVIVSLVQSQELKRTMHPGAETRDVADDVTLTVPLRYCPGQVGPGDIQRLEAGQRSDQRLHEESWVFELASGLIALRHVNMALLLQLTERL